MKAKPLIGRDDYVHNPEGYFGDKIALFDTDGVRFSEAKGHFNYGVFEAVKRANGKSSEILDAVVTYFYGEKDDERNEALAVLRGVAERYKED